MLNKTGGVYSAIGMANRAGKTVTGTDGCLKALKAGKIDLMVISEEASENTMKKITESCAYRNTECIIYGKGEMLGKMTGKDYRIVIGVTDKNLSRLILSKLQHERELMNEQKNQ